MNSLVYLLEKAPFPTGWEDLMAWDMPFMASLHGSTQHISSYASILLGVGGDMDEWFEADVKISIARRYEEIF